MHPTLIKPIVSEFINQLIVRERLALYNGLSMTATIATRRPWAIHESPKEAV
jgi:hypothetical protein